MRNALLVIALGLTVLLAAAPTASAHATAETDDGRFFITAGNLDEPVTTWMRTGLDLIVRVNDNGERGDEVPDLHQTLSATLVAPDGSELSHDLQMQRDTVGRYTFTESYVLTQPGQYKLRLVGEIQGTAVDGLYNVSGPVPDWRDHTFPDEASTPTELAAENAALQQEIAALESRLADLESAHEAMATADNEAPAFAPVALLAGLVLLVALARRRAH